MTSGGAVGRRTAHSDGHNRNEPSPQRWWQGDDGYWYPPTPAPKAASGAAVYMTASPRASVAAGTDPGGGGTPPSPPPTSSSDTSAGGSSAGATEAGEGDEPAGTPGPGRATRRVRALSLAPWASRTAGKPGAKPSARPWPKGAAKAPARPDASGGRVPAAGPLARRPSEELAAATRKALPLWLCIGAPLVAVVVAFVAIAALTAPSGSGRSSVGLRTGAGDDTPATTADDDGGAPDLAAPRATATRAAATGDEVAASTTTEATASDDTGDAEDTSDDAAAAASPATTATTAAPAPEAPAAPAPADTPGDEVRPLLDQVASQLCHPSYLACVPVADDVDCRGEGTGPDHDGPEFTDRVVLIGPDEYRLDSDGDGIGCD